MSTGGLYRSRRVVEARQVTATNAALLAAWCDGDVIVQVRTQGGWLADEGDWIFKEEDGVFEVRSAAQFEAEFSPEPAVES